MAIKRLNKNDIIRGRIFDQLAELYGNSVIGVYEGKLRIEIWDEETESFIQFSLAPIVHKTEVSDSECDPYIPINERIEEYQASLKKNEEKPKKKKKATKKQEDDGPAEGEFVFDSASTVSQEETEDIIGNALTKLDSEF